MTTENTERAADAEVIVIGSGFGGAVVAARLAEAGRRVLLLERGPWRDTVPVQSMGVARRTPFPYGKGALKRVLRSVRAGWLPGGRVAANTRGLFEVVLGRGLVTLCSSSVGGGSHVYAGLNVRPPDPAYWADVSPAITVDGMERGYQRVLERLGSRKPMADDQIPNTLAERFRDVPGLDVRDADYELTMGLLFPATPGAPQKVVTEDGVERFEARYGEEGNLGSVSGGKTTLDVAYLARAIKHGLDVRDLCEVQTVARRADGHGYTVTVRDHHDDQALEFSAPRVVIAAGTINTLLILLRSRARGVLSGMARLGQQFGGNGDFMGYWHLDDAERDLSVGTPARGLIKVADDADSGDWPMVAEGTLIPPSALPLGGWIKKKLARGTFLAGMGADAQDGTVSLDGERLRISYDPEHSPVFARITRAFRRIGEVTQRRVYHFNTPITVHPTGGACIGADSSTGVVDGRGEVFDHPGLYVADAAALPKPVAGPPSLTIATWADHVAEGLLDELARESE